MCTFHDAPWREHIDDDELETRARDGDVDALNQWAESTTPVDYDELGWAD
jgi:hypothetical protein